MMISDRLGRVAYEGYAASTGNKTWDGRDMPDWEDLGETIQKAWQDAVQAVVDYVGPGPRGRERSW